MNFRIVFSTSGRILKQIKQDKMSVGLLFGAPTIVLWLLSYILSDTPGAFNNWGAYILALFPLIFMFLITSIATLRERTSGTLERLMSLPVGKFEFITGYALTFSFLAVFQAVFLSYISFTFFGLEIQGSALLIIVIAVINGLVGTSFGLAVSSLAKTELQAVQFMPLTMFPQLLLAGLITPREMLPSLLRYISDFLPLSYAVDAVKEAMRFADMTDKYLNSILILSVFGISFLIAGSLTLKRETP